LYAEILHSTLKVLSFCRTTDMLGQIFIQTLVCCVLLEVNNFKVEAAFRYRATIQGLGELR